MRQRKLSYRYSMVVTTTQPASLSDSWLADRPGFAMSKTCWTPPTDVYETRNSLTVMIDLAGVEEDRMEALLYENALVVEGRRRLPEVEPDGVFRVAQIRQGPFRVEVALPFAIDSERIETVYDRGLLRIVLPKFNGR